mgnify:CR=1 FL=1
MMNNFEITCTYCVEHNNYNFDINKPHSMKSVVCKSCGLSFKVDISCHTRVSADKSLLEQTRKN